MLRHRDATFILKMKDIITAKDTDQRIDTEVLLEEYRRKDGLSVISLTAPYT
jgi:hypothetical protein